MHLKESQSPQDLNGDLVKYIDSLLAQINILQDYSEDNKTESLVTFAGSYHDEKARTMRFLSSVDGSVLNNSFRQYTNMEIVARSTFQGSASTILTFSLDKIITDYFFQMIKRLNELEGRVQSEVSYSLNTITIEELIELFYMFEERLAVHPTTHKEGCVYVELPQDFELDQQAIDNVVLKGKNSVYVDGNRSNTSDPLFKHTVALSNCSYLKETNAAFVLQGKNLFYFNKEKGIYVQRTTENVEKTLAVLRDKAGSLSPGVCSKPFTQNELQEIYLGDAVAHHMDEVDQLRDNFSELKKIMLPYLEARKVLLSANPKTKTSDTFLPSDYTTTEKKQTVAESYEIVRNELTALKSQVSETNSTAAANTQKFMQKEAENIITIKIDAKEKVAQEAKKDQEEHARITREKEEAIRKENEQENEKLEAIRKKVIEFKVYQHNDEKNIYLVAVPVRTNDQGKTYYRLYQYNANALTDNMKYLDDNGKIINNVGDSFVSLNADFIKKDFENVQGIPVQTTTEFNVYNYDDVNVRVANAVNKYRAQQQPNLEGATVEKSKIPPRPTQSLSPKPPTPSFTEIEQRKKTEKELKEKADQEKAKQEKIERERTEKEKQDKAEREKKEKDSQEKKLNVKTPQKTDLNNGDDSNNDNDIDNQSANTSVPGSNVISGTGGNSGNSNTSSQPSAIESIFASIKAFADSLSVKTSSSEQSQPQQTGQSQPQQVQQQPQPDQLQQHQGDSVTFKVYQHRTKAGTYLVAYPLPEMNGANEKLYRLYLSKPDDLAHGLKYVDEQYQYVDHSIDSEVPLSANFIATDFESEKEIEIKDVFIKDNVTIAEKVSEAVKEYIAQLPPPPRPHSPPDDAPLERPSPVVQPIVHTNTQTQTVVQPAVQPVVQPAIVQPAQPVVQVVTQPVVAQPALQSVAKVTVTAQQAQTAIQPALQVALPPIRMNVSIHSIFAQRNREAIIIEVMEKNRVNPDKAYFLGEYDAKEDKVKFKEYQKPAGFIFQPNANLNQEFDFAGIPDEIGASTLASHLDVNSLKNIFTKKAIIDVQENSDGNTFIIRVKNSLNDKIDFYSLTLPDIFAPIAKPDKFTPSKAKKLHNVTINTTIGGFPKPDAQVNTPQDIKIFLQNNNVLTNIQAAQITSDVTAEIKSAKTGSGNLYVKFTDVNDNKLIAYYRIFKDKKGDPKTEKSSERDFNNKAVAIPNTLPINCNTDKRTYPIGVEGVEFIEPLFAKNNALDQFVSEHFSPNVDIAIEKKSDQTYVVRFTFNDAAKTQLYYQLRDSKTPTDNFSIISKDQAVLSQHFSPDEQYSMPAAHTTISTFPGVLNNDVYQVVADADDAKIINLLDNHQLLQKMDVSPDVPDRKVNIVIKKAANGKVLVAISNSIPDNDNDGTDTDTDTDLDDEVLYTTYSCYLDKNGNPIYKQCEQSEYDSCVVNNPEYIANIPTKKHTYPIEVKGDNAFKELLADPLNSNIKDKIESLLSPNVNIAVQDNFDGSITVKIENARNADAMELYKISFDKDGNSVTEPLEAATPFISNLPRFARSEVHTKKDSYPADQESTKKLLKSIDLLQKIEKFILTNRVNLTLRKTPNGNIIIQVKEILPVGVAAAARTAYFECYKDSDSDALFRVKNTAINEADFNGLLRVYPGIVEVDDDEYEDEASLENLQAHKYCFPMGLSDPDLAPKYLDNLLQKNFTEGNPIKTVIDENLTPNVDVDIEKRQNGDDVDYIIRFRTHTNPVKTLFYKLQYDEDMGEFEVVDRGPRFADQFTPDPTLSKSKIITVKNTFPGKITGDKIEEHEDVDANVIDLLRKIPRFNTRVMESRIPEYYVWRGIIFSKKEGGNYQPIMEMVKGKKDSSGNIDVHIQELSTEKKVEYKQFGQFLKTEANARPEDEFFTAIKLDKPPQAGVDQKLRAYITSPNFAANELEKAKKYNKRVLGPSPKAQYYFLTDKSLVIKWLMPVTPKNSKEKMARFFKGEKYGIPEGDAGYSWAGTWKYDEANQELRVNYFGDETAALVDFNLFAYTAFLEGKIPFNELPGAASATLANVYSSTSAPTPDEFRERQKQRKESLEEDIKKGGALFVYGSEESPFDFGLRSGFEKIQQEKENQKKKTLEAEQLAEMKQRQAIYAPVNIFDSSSPAFVAAPLVPHEGEGDAPPPPPVDPANIAKPRFDYLSADGFKRAMKLEGAGGNSAFKLTPPIAGAAPNVVKIQEDLGKWAVDKKSSRTVSSITINYEYDAATGKCAFNRNINAKPDVELASFAKMLAETYGLSRPFTVVLSQYQLAERNSFRDHYFDVLGYKRDPNVSGVIDGQVQFRYISKEGEGDPKRPAINQGNCNMYVFSSEQERNASINDIINSRAEYKEQSDKVKQKAAQGATATNQGDGREPNGNADNNNLVL